MKDNLDRFKETSKWVPTKVDPVLELFLRNLEEHVFSISANRRCCSNLSRGELLALKM